MHLVLSLVGLWTVACDGSGPEADSAPLGERLATLDRDLTVGSAGPEVRAVHDYLSAFGYFPNAKLAQQWPAWRPVVSQSPVDPAVFDARTSEAVRVFQMNAGLLETGVVDGPTRDALRMPRCGVPDGIPHQDSADKFALLGSRWAGSNVTFTVRNSDDVTFEQARAAAASAFEGWAAQTSLTFSVLNSGAANIQIQFAAIDGVGNTLAQTFAPADGGDMVIDTAETWSVASPSPAGSVDLQTVIVHEIGHALGLDHSSIGGATMFPFFGGLDRSLATDDAVGISTLYDSFQLLPGGANDIGVSSNGTAWVIGTNAVFGGFGIYRFNGSNWDWADGGAVRIAVDPAGVPWVVNSTGQIYRRHSSAAGNVGWTLLPGCARDIGIGANGVVWVIGCPAVFGGSSIHRWNGSNWDAADGGGVRIAVGPTGVPWITNSSGQIYRRNTSAAGSASWSLLPGCGRDIGISVGNYAWSIGCTSVGGGLNIQAWNEQAAIVIGGEVAAPSAARWVTLPGGALNISVGPNARPWVTNNGSAIYRALR